MMRKYFLAVAAVFALAGPALAQSYEAPATMIRPTECGASPVCDSKGYYYFNLSNDEADPHSLRVVLDTAYNPESICSWYVELRQWQDGDDPKTCPGDYVASQLYGPLSRGFSFIPMFPERGRFLAVDFLYIDPAKFSVGGGRTFRLVAKVYHQDLITGQLWDEEVLSDPFHISN